jgi:hypothetical protein
VAQDEYRQWLVEAHHTASRDFDKAVMALAGGALGVSIAFVRDVAPHPQHVWALGVSWTLFGLSLLLIFVSLLTSQSALLHGIKRVDRPPEEAVRDVFGVLTTVLNWSAGGTFIAGVGFLVGFVLYNL